MKKNSLLGLFVMLAILLAGCGISTSRSTRTGALTPQSKLALGTIKLEGTPQAVDSKMAADLLPLWQLLKQLDGSSSAAPEEITAVVDQIQATMSSEQVKAINDMQLTQRDIFTTLQEKGLIGGGNSSGSNTTSTRQSGNSNRFQGGFPNGGFPGGGFFQSGSNTRTNSGTGQQAQGTQSFQSAGSTLLTNEVIQILQDKLKQ